MSVLDDFADILRCPLCGGRLSYYAEKAHCPNDDAVFPKTASGNYDFRLTQPKSVLLNFDLMSTVGQNTDAAYCILSRNETPSVDYSAIDRPYNIDENLLSYFPKASRKGAIALDLGCGEAHFRDVIEHAGYLYLGLDYAHPKASLLGDGQALPFADDSIDFIFCFNVFQSIPFPFVMIEEINRVLRDGGVIIGTVGYLEPDNASFYMYSRRGVLKLLRHGGLSVEFLSPDPWWTAATSVLAKGLFPGSPSIFYRTAAATVEFFSKIWWWLGRMKDSRFTEAERLGRTTGNFSFLAHKEK